MASPETLSLPCYKVMGFHLSLSTHVFHHNHHNNLLKDLGKFSQVPTGMC